MAQGGVLGNGSKVAFSASSPVSWTRVGQLLNFEPPTLEVDEEETTVSSTTSNYKRFMPGMIDVTPMSFTVLQDLDEVTAADQAALAGYARDLTTIWWRIEIPTNRAKTRFKAMEFQGWIKKRAPSADVPSRQETMFEIRFDGDGIAEYNAGSSQIS